MAKTIEGKSFGQRLAERMARLGEATKGSQAWNSIFRPGSIFRRGYTDSPRNRSYVIMNSVLYHLHPVKVKRHAVKVSYTLCLGGLSFFLFILLTVTGIFLMFFYRPTQAAAWDDIKTLETAVTFGSLVRNMHRWGAHLMVLTVFLHIDQAECILCEGCVDICPWKCIHMLSTTAIDEAVNADQPGDDPKDHVFFVVDEDVCTRCALCVDRCPTGVIILGKVTDQWRDGDPNVRTNRHGYAYGVRF